MYMLNIDAFKKSIVKTEPYWHAVIPNILSRKHVKTLVNQLPINNEKQTERQWGSDKTYKVKNSMLFELYSGEQTMPNPWRQLINDLHDPAYRNIISTLWQYDVRNAPMEIIFKRYMKGDYISPHTDRNFVFGTHLLFFNQYWQANWGGLLQILNSKYQPVFEILPLYTDSLLFEQSEHSWHAVNTIAIDTQPRLCLQVAFWRYSAEKIRTPGRMEYINNE